MNKELVIFGLSEIAELAHFYFTNHTDYKVVAFTVDSAFKTKETFCSLPVVEFEKINTLFPSSNYSLFIALSYSSINTLRMNKFHEAKKMRYQLASYISPHATVLTENPIGENCFILEDNTIQPFVTIGHNVTLWSGNHIGHHSSIEDHCFISSHVVISGGVTVKSQSFLGVNATIRDHVTIGEKSVIGAGALILEDIDPEGVYIGSKTERSKVPSSRLRKI